MFHARLLKGFAKNFCNELLEKRESKREIQLKEYVCVCLLVKGCGNIVGQGGGVAALVRGTAAEALASAAAKVLAAATAAAALIGRPTAAAATNNRPLRRPIAGRRRRRIVGRRRSTVGIGRRCSVPPTAAAAFDKTRAHRGNCLREPVQGVGLLGQDVGAHTQEAGLRVQEAGHDASLGANCAGLDSAEVGDGKVGNGDLDDFLAAAAAVGGFGCVV